MKTSLFFIFHSKQLFFNALWFLVAHEYLCKTDVWCYCEWYSFIFVNISVRYLFKLIAKCYIMCVFVLRSQKMKRLVLCIEKATHKQICRAKKKRSKRASDCCDVTNWEIWPRIWASFSAQYIFLLTKYIYVYICTHVLSFLPLYCPWYESIPCYSVTSYIYIYICSLLTCEPLPLSLCITFSFFVCCN